MELVNFICFFGFFLMLFNLIVVEGETSGEEFLLKSALDPGFADEEVDHRNKSAEEDLYVYHDDGGDRTDAYADEYDEDLEALDVSIRAILNCPAAVTCPPGELCTMSLNFPNCFHPATACKFLTCKNGGTCVNERCNCKPGFSGHICAHTTAPSNGCVPGYCHNGGRCVAHVSGQPTCESCNPGFGGPTCRSPSCNGFICHNGGMCSISTQHGARPRCSCLPSFVGPRCQSPRVAATCPTKPWCMNGGKCVPDGNGLRCICVPPYLGIRCQTNFCAGHCQNGGTCSLVDPDSKNPTPTCTCPPNWTGTRCMARKNSACDGVVCANGGTCHPEGGTYRCDCMPPFIGMTCNSTPCHNFCFNGGQCYLTNPPTCQCPPPYLGVRCQDDYCTDHCKNGGTCSLIGRYGNITSCACVGPFTGSTCLTRLNVCDGVVCANGGTCEPQGTSFRCSCMFPFTGQLCRDSLCTGYCYNGGRCTIIGVSTTPSCACRPSYTGERCQTLIPQPPNPCSTVECGHGGTCIPQGDSFRCSCIPPYTGLLCQTNPCTGYCLNGGSCSTTFGSTTPICTCIRSYTGERCQYPGPPQPPHLCSQVVCAHGGTCVTQGNSFRCSCSPPYTGRYCQIPGIPQPPHPCSQVVCAHGGTCVTQGNSFRCSCTPPYTGRYCQIPGIPQPPHPCSQVVCAHGGTCVAQGNSFRCSCTPRYTGRYCQIPGPPQPPHPCSQVVCAHGGTCVTQGNSFRCSCTPRYTGRYCQIPGPPQPPHPCSQVVCAHGGTCVTQGNSFRCSCTPPYTGRYCQIPGPPQPPHPCSQVVCAHGGTCVTQGNSFRCSCTPRYTGRYCQIPGPPQPPHPCSQVVCAHGGTCVAQGNSFRCSCVPPYTGRFCQIPGIPTPAHPCNIVVCAHGGTCIPQGNSYRCSCLPPYTGRFCHTDRCAGFCYNGGSCSIVGDSPSCTCVDSYSGQRCQIPPVRMPAPQPCNVAVCANGGTCTPQGSSYRCSCVLPFTGPLCQDYKPLISDQCSGYCYNGGYCKMFNYITPTCTCVAPYTGQRCEIPPARTTQSPQPCAFVVCANGGTCIPQGNSYRCSCIPPFTGHNCLTNPCFGYCYNGGSCSMPFGSNTPICACVGSYSGQRCQVITTQSPQPCTFVVCANGGTCIPQGNSYSCSCAPPYTGHNCLTNPCFGYCYNGGSCSTPFSSTTPICACVGSYTGQRCQVPPAVVPRPPRPCLFVVCANGGTCVPQGSSFRCSCEFPYTGDRCQKSPCSDYCLHNGQCTMINGIQSCVCSPPYSGKRCTELLNDPCENAFCPHDQTCQPVGTSYRCTRVEPPSTVCQPDPCQGDCKCTASCKHEGGYLCVTERGFLGKHCDIPIPEIRCSADEIVVEVSPRFYNEFDADQRNSILFMSPSADGVGRSTTQCQSQLVDGSYRIAVSHPFTQCGTTVGTERGVGGGDMVVFTNEVWLNKNFGQSGGYDMPFPVVRLQCKYSDEYVIYTSLKPTVAPIHGLIFGEIQYDVTPSICKVSTCGEPCPQQFAVQKSAVFTVGQIIHFGFDVTSRSTNVNEGTATLLHATVSCSDSLDIQPLQTQSFDLVKDGCPTEHGTALMAQLGSPASPKHLCMSFRLPRSKVCSEIFIHIHLKMCLQTVSATCPDGNTVPACASRKRRSISSVNAEPITIGPIFLVERETGQEQVAFLADDAIIDVISRPNVTERNWNVNKTLRKTTLNPTGFDKTTLTVVTVLAILLACFGIAIVLFIHRLQSSKPTGSFH